MSPSPLWKKLNLKDQAEVVILDAPPTFAGEMAALGNTGVRTRVPARPEVAFVLAFVTKQKQIDAVARTLGTVTVPDAIVWFAYPKGTSKRYTCDFNRDTGWQALGDEGFEPVRMVAIDEDWSAVRFRRTEFIKTMTRSSRHALSAAGKARARPR